MIKTQHKEVPESHRFPDGTVCRYWRGRDMLVYGQVFKKNGKPESAKFRYHGDTP